MASVTINIELTDDDITDIKNHVGGLLTTAVEALTAISASVDTLVADVQRLIEVLQASGNLSPEAQALVDSVSQKLTDLDSAVDTAAPETP